jgi:hypothetical protein
MEAGYGAEEQASRKARRLERLKREQAASDAADAATQEQIARAQEDVRRWSQGAEGERLVAQTLSTLSRYGWTALHDVHWPGRPQANIDHIAVGPGGVLIIDAKNWTGQVAVREGVLYQNGYRRTEEVAGVLRACDAVTALLAPQHRMRVAPMLCLVSQDQDPVKAQPGSVVVGRHQLAATLVGLAPCLTPFDVADIARFLERELGGERSPELLTTAELARAPRRRPRGSRAPAYAATRRTAGPRSQAPRRTEARPVRDAFLGCLVTIAGLMTALVLLGALMGVLGR